MLSRVSQGEKPAFFRMNQKGIRMMRRQTRMMMGIIAIKATIAAVGSESSRKNAKYCIQNTPEMRLELEVTLKPNGEIRNQILA